MRGGTTSCPNCGNFSVKYRKIIKEYEYKCSVCGMGGTATEEELFQKM